MSQFFETSILPLRNKLYRFASHWLRDGEQAKDLVQDALLKAWNKRAQLDQIDNHDAWMMRMVKNMAIDSLRKDQKRPQVSVDVIEHLTAAEVDRDEDVFQAQLQLAKQILGDLPDKQRAIMQLREVEGYSYQQIAEVLEISLEQVKVNVFRARQKMREQVQKKYKDV
ncbi:RNA polymerase sigma factor [Penaeicola halotolerans]|uniref:RNA polymerase sigma factor n=1 Tax=Penaeicola halotolerans TaxID=2793196 RepID=UPI001CF8EC85|nr:RNA polymerase sigma factor [Penaeicola halotolerans]